jgi:putative transposase
VKFRFVAKHKGIWPLALTCDASGVSRGFYAWLTRTPRKRRTDNEQLGRAVHHNFIQSHRTYGARGVWHDL